MIKTAYELALNPTMPLRHFKILIKCQRENGVVLIERRDNNKAAKEYIHSIAEVIREKCAAIIASKHFISLLSDGSQARKTGSEKELVLTRVERNGIPCYLMTSLLEMSTYGGGTADGIKEGLDTIFDGNKGVIKISPEEYQFKVVSATADGASVNTGIYSGVLTQLTETRPWMLSIHCSNHRIELAFKAAVSNSPFKICDDIYIAIFFLHKNSGKLTSAVQEAYKVLNINGHKKLPKIHGTRFVNHRRRGFKAFLDMWPALITAYENALSDSGGKKETKAKINGFLSKLRSYKFFCQMASYLDILDAIGPASSIFESENVMPYELESTIERTTIELEEIARNAGSDDEILNSYISKFQNDDGCVTGVFLKDGHGRRKEENRETVNVVIQGMKQSDNERNTVAAAKKTLALDLKDLLQKRFNEGQNEVYVAMKFYDPQYWTEEPDYGVSALKALLEHFREPFSFAGLDERRIFVEWRGLKSLIKRNYSEFLNTPNLLWKRILLHRRAEFPNVSLVIELIMSISGSNCAVERAFSILTMMLSDQRLLLHHSVMEDIMIIKCNDHVWTTVERKEIIEAAVNKYLQKRRKTRLLDTNATVSKKAKEICTAETAAETVQSSSSESSENDSDFYDFDSELFI